MLQYSDMPPHVIIFLLSHACMPLLLLTDLNAIVYFVAVKHHHNFNAEVRTGYVLNRALVNKCIRLLTNKLDKLATCNSYA